jgi:hypothetical protein
MQGEDAARKERVYWRMFRGSGAPQVTDEDLAYFRDHPDEIDEVTAPVNVHKLFLWAGALLGIALVAASKMLGYGPLLDAVSAGVSEFVIDIVFEIGVALIGAAVTAYLLGILLNRQQENAAAWRAEIRQRLGQEETR